ncbi:MAG TPA: DUF1015 domain-containing protein [Opitutae bacterium]|jgi:uncharacterized protein (DUF1015 family)|nr:DUF1015 domain-containing protein [Opitutae bacterium]
MSKFRPFRAIRPLPEDAKQVASRPYDVLNSDEARLEAADNPISFLRVIKPEIDLPSDSDPYGEEVYRQGLAKLTEFKELGILVQDPEAFFYVYRLTMDGRTQTGIVGCCDYQEYYDGSIKKHELTRTAKENDRVRHVETQNANAEPVFFSYRGKPGIDSLVNEVTRSPIEYDFVAEDGIRHELWVVRDRRLIENFESGFAEVPALYVADGHHRTAAAARVGQMRKEDNSDHTGEEEYNFFMAVLFPDDQLKIFDYNRVVRDLNGLSQESFLSAIKQSFEISAIDGELAPTEKGTFSMYLGGVWYRLKANKEKLTSSPKEGLDVTYLSDEVLEPILGISDLRNDLRIDFVGGIRGLGELERRVDSGEMAVAFALFPVSMEELLAIADAGEIMPPKTTWFEPKLRSGLFIHDLE